MVEGSAISIKEAYRAYKPPINAARVVGRLLRSVPSKYVRGLDCVVLSSFSGQPRRNRLGKTTSRGGRVHKSKILGLYHQKWGGQRPWIELYVDQILRSWPQWMLWIPFARDVAIGSTLYHELGHHVHLFIRPEYREKEDVADDWGKRFMKLFLRRHYWYLIPVAAAIKLFRR